MRSLQSDDSLSQISGHAASLGVFIGRFQPFHLGHQFIIQKALERVDSLVIVIGSSQDAPRSFKNPFTFEERKALIQANLKDLLPMHEFSRVNVIGVPDVPHDDNAWKALIASGIKPFLNPLQPDVFLIGHDKDESTYYLNLLKDFEHWKIWLLDKYHDIDGTKIREAYFSRLNPSELHPMLPPMTENFLSEFSSTPAFQELANKKLS
jgi:bifunctional NMN adenylyltransferase/nudix hydrolase